jgi:MoxR-like ATPase
VATSFGRKSCQSCPSFHTEQQTVGHINKNLQAATCSKLGKVLSIPGANERHLNKIWEITASGCSEYGKPERLATMADMHLTVAMPNPKAMTEPIDPNLAGITKSCAMCKWYMEDSTVTSRWGWWSGLCTAKGRLIIGNRQTYEARDCEYKQFGHNVTDTSTVMLLPEFEDRFWEKGALKDLLAKQASRPDPTTYPTDKPVSAEDTALGVRAWRQVLDPEGTGNFTYLPIFDGGFFSETEQAKIPKTGDDEHPESYIDHNGAVYKIAVAWMELDETPALWGVAGTGKTELLRHMAWLMQLPFERISITGSTELDDLAGKMLFEDGETVFKYGRVPLAWSKPSVICLDEPNVGPPDVWQFIRPLTDNSKQLVLDQNKGERIPRHESCFMGLAMNPAWDAINVGAQTIGDADGSRLLHLFMELPPPEIEKEIIRTRCKFDGWDITDAQLNTIMAIAADLRGLVESGSLPISWGIRPQIKVARAARWFDLIQAYRMGAADYLEPQAQEEMLNVVRAHAEGGRYGI